MINPYLRILEKKTIFIKSGKILSPKNYRSEIIYDHRKHDIHDPKLHLYSEGEDVMDDPNDRA